ncbi:MAG: amidase [Planctomycetota bacterium]|jgi:aspartyl-tRNA(Asn)/glutamyl-tRNA(Gln) amidotransferase subunit A
MPELISIPEAARRIRKGRLRPLDLVERCLARIEELDRRVRAWVVVDEEAARRAAGRLEEDLARGHDRGPLHGIPVGIKDIVDVAGLPTRAGSPLTDTRNKPADAPLVAALRQAGAVILGKTVTCQFACFDPSPTRNPWHPDLRHTPGGSSSGSAVAVALGMCLGAIGTQTGGSLVRPASYCGVAALKPTFSRIPTEGVMPVSHHLDHPGPIARTAGDLACLLEPLLDDADPEGLSPQAGPPRLGFVEDFFIEEADGPIRTATETALGALRQGGAKTEPVALPRDFADVHRMHRTIMAVEAATVHRGRFPARRGAYGPAIAGLLDEGLAASAVDYAEALAHQRKFRRRIAAIFEPFDALVMPATDTTAPASLETTGNPRFQSPWSYAGVPVVSIPCGLAEGMPAALQLVGRHGTDGSLLRVAQWCERRLGFGELPPPVT